MLLENLILTYIAILVVFYLHELGHLPSKGRQGVIMQFFPPFGQAMDARSRYGGLAVNFALFFLVWFYKPETLFFQIIGFVAFAHFVLYTIFGSFNKETKQVVNGFIILDDIPNKYWYIFVPAGLAVLWYFGPYFLELFQLIYL